MSVLFEAQGATTTTSAALDWLLATALGVGDGAGVDGAEVGVVLPSLGRCDAPGRLDGDWCVVEGLGTAALGRGDTALVVAQTPDGAATFAVDLGLLTRRPVQGLDPALGLFEVVGEFETAWAAQPTAADWPAAAALGQLALGHELVGAGRTMLELARTHVERHVHQRQQAGMAGAEIVDRQIDAANAQPGQDLGRAGCIGDAVAFGDFQHQRTRGHAMGLQLLLDPVGQGGIVQQQRRYVDGDPAIRPFFPPVRAGDQRLVQNAYRSVRPSVRFAPPPG